MWLPWVKTRSSSPTSASTCSSTALAAASPRLSFNSPSLKDLQALLRSDPAAPSPSPPQPPHTAPCSPSGTRVFHRVRVAASALCVLRTLQAPPAAAEADRRVSPVSGGEHRLGSFLFAAAAALVFSGAFLGWLVEAPSHCSGYRDTARKPRVLLRSLLSASVPHSPVVFRSD